MIYQEIKTEAELDKAEDEAWHDTCAADLSLERMGCVVYEGYLLIMGASDVADLKAYLITWDTWHSFPKYLQDYIDQKYLGL